MEGYKNINLTKEQQIEITKLFGKFEKVRKKAWLKYNLAFWGGVSLIVAGILFFIIPSVSMGKYVSPGFCILVSFISVSLIVLGVFTMCIPKKIKRGFKSKIKNRCFGGLLKHFDNLKWYENIPSYKNECESNVEIRDKILERSALFTKHDGRLIDDEFKGSYKDIDFAISETHMHGYTSKGGEFRTDTIFKGVVVLFKSNKKVLNRTIVSTKRDYYTGRTSFSLSFYIAFAILLFGTVKCFIDGDIKYAARFSTYLFFTIIVMFATLFGKEEPLNKVTLEDPEFNKKFNVYSSNQVEARYLVTTAFMERLNNLTTAFGTNKVKCSFFDDKFMVAISTKKDLFEIGDISKPLNSLETVDVFFKELNSIYEMIDYFKLDEKTGL